MKKLGQTWMDKPQWVKVEEYYQLNVLDPVQDWDDVELIYEELHIGIQ